MALRLRNRLDGSGSGSIGSVVGSRDRGIHAVSLFVVHYAPGLNSIKLGYGLPLPLPNVKPLPPSHSLYSGFR